MSANVLSFKRLALFAPACAMAVLSGCLFAKNPPEPPAEPAPPTPLAAYMIGHAPGDSTTLDDPDFGQQVRVTMQHEFTSAIGEPCKSASLLAGQRESEIAVICQKLDGTWRMAPRVWGQGIQTR